MIISLNNLRTKIYHHYSVFCFKRDKLSEIVGAIEGENLSDSEIHRVKTQVQLMKEELDKIEEFLDGK